MINEWEEIQSRAQGQQNDIRSNLYTQVVLSCEVKKGEKKKLLNVVQVLGIAIDFRERQIAVFTYDYTKR